MSRYAQGTAVPVDRSIAELKANVRRFGAEEFGYVESGTEATVGFVWSGYRVEMSITLPNADDAEFATSPSGRLRTDGQIDSLVAREARRRWRSLKEVVKILCVAVDDGVLTFEQAFLSHLVLGNGRTVGHTLLPMLQEAKGRGALPGSLRMDKKGRLLPTPPCQAEAQGGALQTEATPGAEASP